jgi:CDP-glycerol glycerophosphotransferase (TagB/SpsB family)/GT2 family glycosyltransferase/glycosyltransferase involved in cell wall biosynthesis
MTDKQQGAVARSFWHNTERGKIGPQQLYQKQQQFIEDRVLPLLKPDDELLDIGCADGEFSLLFCKALKRVTAIDIGKNLIAQAKQRALEAHIDNVDFIAADIFQMVIERQHFDAVSLMGVLTTISDDEAALRVLLKATEMLKHDGLLILKDSLRINETESKTLRNQEYEAIYRAERNYIAMCRSLGLELVERYPLVTMENAGQTSIMYVFKQKLPQISSAEPVAGIRVACYGSMPFHFRSLKPLSRRFENSLLSLSIEEVMAWKPQVIVVADGWSVGFWRDYCDAHNVILIGMRHGSVTRYGYAEPEYNSADFMCGSYWDVADAINSKVMPRYGFALTGNTWVDETFKLERKTINKQQPTILFAPTYNPEISAAVYFGDRIIQLIRSVYPHSKIIIKPHPAIVSHEHAFVTDKAMFKALMNQWRQAEENDPLVVLIDNPEASIAESFAEADILVADASSLTFEYMTLQRPILLYSTDTKIKNWEFNVAAPGNAWRDIGLEFSDDQTFLMYLQDAFNLHQQYTLASQNARTEMLYGQFQDGESISRVVNLISHLPKIHIVCDFRMGGEPSQVMPALTNRLSNVELYLVGAELIGFKSFPQTRQWATEFIELAENDLVFYLKADSGCWPDNAMLNELAAASYLRPTENIVFRQKLSVVESTTNHPNWLLNRLGAAIDQIDGEPVWLFTQCGNIKNDLAYLKESDDGSFDLWRRMLSVLPSTRSWGNEACRIISLDGVYPRVGADDYFIGNSATFQIIAPQSSGFSGDPAQPDIVELQFNAIPGQKYLSMPFKVEISVGEQLPLIFEMYSGVAHKVSVPVLAGSDFIDIRINSDSVCDGLQGLTQPLSLLATIKILPRGNASAAYSAADAVVTRENVIEFIETIQENTTITWAQAALTISQDKVPELRDPAQRHQLYKEVAARMIEEGKKLLAVDAESQFSDAFRSELTNSIGLLNREMEFSQADPIVVELKTTIRQLLELSDYHVWIKKHGLMEIDAQIHAERMMAWQYRPRFHLFMFVFNDEQNLLADTIASLGQQFYPDWKLTVIADSSAPDSMFEELDVLEWLQFPEHEEPYAFLNQKMAASAFDWVGFVPAGTQFEPQTWLQFGDYINHFQEKTAFYCDDDFIKSDAERLQPRFKPDFNLDLLRSTDYIGPIICKRSLFESIKGFDKVPGHENLSLGLKIYERVGANGIGHISDLLMHLPVSVQSHYSTEMSKQAVQQHLIRQQLHAVADEGLVENSVRVIYQWPTTPKVSIIIPTKDKLEFLRPCVEAALYRNSYPNFEVIVVNNLSEEIDTLAYLDELRARQDVDLTVMDYPHPFNYAAISNLAAKQAKGEYLLFLNNDTEALHPEWLERMMAHAQRPEVGVVGARLVYPESGMLQHAGVIMGMTHVADHPYLGELNIREPGYMNRAQLDQNFSAVTGACLLIRKSVFDRVGGMNETELAVLYNDVDLCLKVRETDHLVVWTPYAVLVHHGSVSQKSEYLKPAVMEKSRNRSLSEGRYMLKTWMHYIANDPASNRHLSLAHRDLRIESEMPTNWDTTFHDRPRILGLPLVGGSGEYRVVQPFSALSQAGVAQCEYYRFNHNKTRSILISEYARMAPDSVVFQAAVNDIQLSQLEQLHDSLPNVFRIYTIDDLLTNVPEQSPAHKDLKRHFYDVKTRLRKALQFSDRLIVSTQPLADLCRDMIKDIRVIPNRLQREPWVSLQSVRNQSKKPRVGWAGAQQHQGDLAIMSEVVKATADEVDWIFMGMCPDEIKPYVHEYHHFVPINDYPAKLASLNLDLAVAPLEIHPFNEAKSNLRLLEYGVLGWPVICTDIYPYQTNNPPVVRVSNEVESWVAAIRQLLADKAALIDAGSALKAWVLQHYILEDHLDEWLEALTKN